MPRQTEDQLVRMLATSRNDEERKRLRGVLAQRRYRQRRKLTKTPQPELSPLTEEIGIEDNVITTVGEDWWDTDQSFFPELEDLSQTTEPPYTLMDFADEEYLRAPALGLVKAHITVLTTLFKSMNLRPVIDTIWNPFAKSPFESYSSQAVIPGNYRPTATQLNLPHHPVFDLLPWPSVREKMLVVLSLPSEVRPRKAQGDMAEVAMELKFDMMDSAEGIKVHGMDAFDSRNWEIGQRIFDGWWWALDTDIVRHSNAYREKRGADKLRLKEVT